MHVCWRLHLAIFFNSCRPTDNLSTPWTLSSALSSHFFSIIYITPCHHMPTVRADFHPSAPPPAPHSACTLQLSHFCHCHYRCRLAFHRSIDIATKVSQSYNSWVISSSQSSSPSPSQSIVKSSSNVANHSASQLANRWVIFSASQVSSHLMSQLPTLTLTYHDARRHQIIATCYVTAAGGDYLGAGAT